MISLCANCFTSVPSSYSSLHLRPHSKLPHSLSYFNFKPSKFTSLTINARGRICHLFDLHDEQIPYEVAWSWQKEIVREKKAQIKTEGDCNDSLIILQHPSVYTLGTGSTEDNLIFDKNNAPFHVYRTERGGEVTYHGPGQIVMYPIINLRRYKMDLHWYLRTLEEVVIRVLSKTFSIQASQVEDLTGVSVGNEKLAAVGIRVDQWITYHGLALNVTTDLTPFNWIIPCGVRGRQVGSIKGLLSTQSGITHETADIHSLEDASLIHITHKSLKSSHKGFILSTIMKLFLYLRCMKTNEVLFPKKDYRVNSFHAYIIPSLFCLMYISVPFPVFGQNNRSSVVLLNTLVTQYSVPVYQMFTKNSKRITT